MKSPAAFSTERFSPSPYSCRTRPSRMYSMTSKPTCTCAYATAPGGTTATFMESCFAGTFFDDMPILYWMPFQDRETGLPRMTKIPSEPSIAEVRSDSNIRGDRRQETGDRRQGDRRQDTGNRKQEIGNRREGRYS